MYKRVSRWKCTHTNTQVHTYILYVCAQNNTLHDVWLYVEYDFICELLLFLFFSFEKEHQFVSYFYSAELLFLCIIANSRLYTSEL